MASNRKETQNEDKNNVLVTVNGYTILNDK